MDYFENFNTENPNEEEEYEVNNLNYSSKSTRLNFIKKVYSILLTQILFTSLMISCSIFIEAYRKFFISNTWLFFLAIIATFVVLYILVYTNQARKVPQNYILLFIFTLCEGYTLSFVGFYDKGIILAATILTLAITIGLTVYAFTTDTDVTMQGGLFFILGSVFMGLIIVGIFVKTRWYVILVSAFGTVLYGLYIVYDTQLILGTKSASLSIDDYILAALMLYIDIVGLFVQILELLNAISDN